MTRMELVDAFVRGDLDRRQFVGKLTAMGVSAGAAMAYAGSLVQDAAAAPGRNGAGFVARAAQVDDEYGAAFVLESVAAAVEAITEVGEDVLTSLTALVDTFTLEDFLAAGLTEEDYELLLTMNSQLEEQLEAINALPGTASTTVTRRGFQGASTQNFSSVQEALTAAASGYSTFVGLLAGVIPALESGEDRQITANVGLVSARHAGLVNYLAGSNPIPSPFEEPIDPATL